MIKNKLIFFLTAIFFLVVTLNFILALDPPQCCTLAKNEAQCVSIPSDECTTGNFAPTSCDSPGSLCAKGVCVDIESGECVENTPQLVCEGNGGSFKTDAIHNIPECQLGCCILGGIDGEQIFSTEIACQETASDEGIDFSFREDITSSNECLGLSFEDEEGACVIKTGFETKCKRTLGKDCQSGGTGGLSDLLDKYVSGISVTTEFHQGMLCTAEDLDADCEKSQKTTCYKDDVYYKDTCGNRANVFNSAKYSDSASSDYWTLIRNPSDVCSPVVGGSDAATSCGNCDYYSSTKCRSPQSGDSKPNNQLANFENICGDLKCGDYQNTESWCAPTPGTPWETFGKPGGSPGIEMNLTNNGTYIYKKSKDELFKPLDYNLPGSEYVKLECYEGEILPVKCKGKRDQVCKQYEQEGRTRAECEVNNAEACKFKLNRDECNGVSDCYWLSGNSSVIGGHEDEGSVWSITEEEVEEQGYNAGRFPDDEREQKQGSCVPLFAPGNEFWTEAGQTSCMTAKDFPRRVIYETNLLQDRKDFVSDSEKTDGKWSYTGSKDNKPYKRQSRCSGNCFAIPNFGAGLQEKIADLWNGKEWKTDWGEGKEPVSDRRGQYCHKKDKPWSPKSGQVGGKTVNCIDVDEDDENDEPGKRYNKPEFYTHSSWLKFIGIRARASGDCGITNNFVGDAPSYDSEKITTTVQKVKQDQQEVKGDVVKGILYRGEDLADLDAPKFNGKIYEGTSESVI